MLFKAFLPYLDGENDIENEVFGKIKNDKLKNFYIKLLETLRVQKFVLYSDKKINMSKYDDFIKPTLFYCGDLRKLKNITKGEYLSIKIISKSERVNNVLFEKFKDKVNKVTTEIKDIEYIMINVCCSKDIIQTIYLYKNNIDNTIIISSQVPDIKKIDVEFWSLPLHIFEILACILKIEIDLKFYNIEDTHFIENDFIFDLRLLSLKQRINE